MPDEDGVRRNRRVVRSSEHVGGSTGVARAIEDLYEDRVDVVVVRDAVPAGPLASAAALLSTDDETRAWSRPNAVAPPDDIYILGTDAPATPTYSAPTGASFAAYLEGASKHRTQTADVFPSGFDAVGEIERTIGRAGGGRPVALAHARDGRPFTPFTLRRLADGKQIGLHHDYHYRLALYSELAPQLDTTTLVSWVFTLQRPDAGGELVVYGLTPDDTDVPKGPNGRPDVDGVERVFDHKAFATDCGDFFLLASGRCYHRVSPVHGSARVTMGGFLALDAARERILYWS